MDRWLSADFLLLLLLLLLLQREQEKESKLKWLWFGLLCPVWELITLARLKNLWRASEFTAVPVKFTCTPLPASGAVEVSGGRTHQTADSDQQEKSGQNTENKNCKVNRRWQSAMCGECHCCCCCCCGFSDRWELEKGKRLAVPWMHHGCFHCLLVTSLFPGTDS